MTTLTWNFGGGLVAASVLAACATGGGDGGTSKGSGAAAPVALCTGPMTQVTINPQTLGTTTGTIKVNPGSAHIDPSGGGVRWKFNHNTYSFATDGVVFKTSLPGPASAPATGDPTVYVWCFNDTSSNRAGSWPYTINFSANSAPTKIWSCDPTIVNRSTLLAVETVTCTAPVAP